MMTRRTTLTFLILLQHWALSEESAVNPGLEPEKGTCVLLETTRSTNGLYLGNEDAENILLMEFPLSKLTSYLSSFDLRTFDSEGVIFYGDIGGEGNWFVLALREKHLEVQMSNENGKMVLTKWGPNMSDGIWRKVSVDRNANTIEVRVDGEVVISLMHYVNAPFSVQGDWKLRIVVGDLPPNNTAALLKPINPSLDGCMRDWSWVQKEANILTSVMESNEQRRCFEHEEEGAYFPGHGYAEFEAPSFPSSKKDGENSTAWTLTATFSFRPVVFNGILLAVQDENNTNAFSFAMDKVKRVFMIRLFDQMFSSNPFPLDLCKRQWLHVQLILQNNHLSLKTPVAQSECDMSAEDVHRLENIWRTPTTTIYIGGTPGSTAEESFFAGCLKMLLQGNPVELDKAKNKHRHIRAYSCPKALGDADP
ncbi:vitamin K-dependent protein S-like [Ambystoma mexicanum]|uniref:vitamin K-dependent protein S-like n=1 Tax=Ambystoma mexicanum TaxID=8296 RepID=UPI0037E7334D